MGQALVLLSTNYGLIVTVMMTIMTMSMMGTMLTSKESRNLGTGMMKEKAVKRRMKKSQKIKYGRERRAWRNRRVWQEYVAVELREEEEEEARERCNSAVPHLSAQPPQCSSLAPVPPNTSPP